MYSDLEASSARRPCAAGATGSSEFSLIVTVDIFEKSGVCMEIYINSGGSPAMASLAPLGLVPKDFVGKLG